MDGSAGSLQPLSSLSKRQLAIHEALGDSGATGFFTKKSVSMNDLRSLSKATGDEYSMFTLGSRRFVVRGYGNEVRVTADMADALKAGKYGRWSGHTHPPGYGGEASIFDRNWLPNGQSRSALWHDGGHTIFHATPFDDAIFESQRRAIQMRRFYGQ